MRTGGGHRARRESVKGTVVEFQSVVALDSLQR
jgi:hypothetical protein